MKAISRNAQPSTSPSSINKIFSFSPMIDWMIKEKRWHHMQVCTAKMNLSDEVDLEDYVSRPDKISAAEVSDTTRFSLN